MSGVVTALSTVVYDEAIYEIVYTFVHFIATLVIVYIGYYVITKAVNNASKEKADIK